MKNLFKIFKTLGSKPRRISIGALRGKGLSLALVVLLTGMLAALNTPVFAENENGGGTTHLSPGDSADDDSSAADDLGLPSIGPPDDDSAAGDLAPYGTDQDVSTPPNTEGVLNTAGGAAPPYPTISEAAEALLVLTPEQIQILNDEGILKPDANGKPDRTNPPDVDSLILDVSILNVGVPALSKMVDNYGWKLAIPYQGGDVDSAGDDFSETIIIKDKYFGLIVVGKPIPDSLLEEYVYYEYGMTLEEYNEKYAFKLGDSQAGGGTTPPLSPGDSADDDSAADDLGPPTIEPLDDDSAVGDLAPYQVDPWVGKAGRGAAPPYPTISEANEAKNVVVPKAIRLIYPISWESYGTFGEMFAPLLGNPPGSDPDVITPNTEGVLNNAGGATPTATEAEQTNCVNIPKDGVSDVTGRFPDGEIGPFSSGCSNLSPYQDPDKLVSVYDSYGFVWRAQEEQSGARHFEQGVNAYDEKDYVKALEHFRKAAKLDPSLEAEIHLYLGRIAIQMKRWRLGALELLRAKKLGLSEEREQEANIALAYILAYGEFPRRPAPAASSKATPEIGLEDQWGIKAINWDPSLVPSEGSVVVAVIDSGVDYYNEQLKDAIWINPSEIINMKDDGNGYIDDVIGWNFFADNNNPMDDYGHGTMTAGIIAARPINGKGIFGVNPGAKIMNLKVIDEAGNTGTRDVARAIYYAVHHGAKVINLSLGEKTPSFVVDAAIAYARKQGVVVVVASGNDAMDTSKYSSGSKGALAVAAIDMKNKRLAASNWGQEVDIAAPGKDILSLRAKDTDMLLKTGSVPYKKIGDREYWPWKQENQDSEIEDYSHGKNIVKEGYYHATGTSFSAPFVSGVASLLFARNSKLTAEQVTRMILHSARDIEVPGWDQLSGYGLLDAKAALEADPNYYTIARINKIAPAKKKGKLVIEVYGTARSSEFKKAWVELGFGEHPKKWKKVGKIRKEVKENILAEITSKEFKKKGKWSVRVVVKTKKHGTKEGWGNLNIQ